MGIEQDPAGAGSSSAAAVAPDSQARAAAYPTPQSTPQHQAVPPTYTAPNVPPPGPYSGPPPNYYAQQPPLVVEGRPPMVSIISPEDAKKIRKMQWINFSCTMTQLVCSLVIILLVRNNLTSVQVTSSTATSGFLNVECFAATPYYPSTCEYAYSLASVSIFFCFILSLMQCLTMDCCGMGRAVEAGFDAAACVWWIAGGITLGVRASEANAARIERQNERNAVVALCWISAFMFLALLVTNLVLIKRLGRAYKHAAQQMQQHMTAYPVGGVQMVPMGQNTGPYPQQGHFQQQPYVQPGAYPPQSGMAGGYNAPPPGPYSQQQQQPQQQQQWMPPAGYPTTPPTGHNAV